MTDRYSGFVVALDEDIREDDAETVVAAIRMIKGVIRVEPLMPDPHEAIVLMRRDAQWQDGLRRLARSGPNSEEH